MCALLTIKLLCGITAGGGSGVEAMNSLSASGSSCYLQAREPGEQQCVMLVVAAVCTASVMHSGQLEYAL